MGYMPVDTNIRNVLNADLVYSVPRFQRKFVWNSFNWSDFLNDIERSNQDNYHFVGCLIFEKLNNGNEQRIIDGQQRLTTSLILLSLIAKYFSICNAPDKRDALRKYCFWTDTNNNSVFKLENKQYEDILDHIVSRYCFDNNDCVEIKDFLKQERLSDSSNIVDCFKFFESKLKHNLGRLETDVARIEFLETLRNSLFELKCITITAEREQEGYLIFEVLNSRGMPLAQHELIKNYLFTHDCAVDDSDTALHHLQRIENNVEPNPIATGKSFDSFISDYIICKFGEKDKKQTDYIFFRNCVLPVSAHDVLLDLVDKSELYKNILLGISENPVEQYVYQFLKKFNISIVRPLLLSLAVLEGEQLPRKNYNKTLLWIKSYLARYVVVFGQRTNAIDPVIKTSAEELGQSGLNFRKIKEIINKTKEELISKLPKDKEFQSEFLAIMVHSRHKEKYSDYKLSSKNTNACRFALEELEIAEGAIEDYKVSKFSIEHIKKDSDGGKACLLGNLIPLQPRKNNNLGDKDPIGKIETYKNSAYRTANMVGVFIESNKNSWDDDAIEERSKNLAKRFDTVIWRLR